MQIAPTTIAQAIAGEPQKAAGAPSKGFDAALKAEEGKSAAPPGADPPDKASPPPPNKALAGEVANNEPNAQSQKPDYQTQNATAKDPTGFLTGKVKLKATDFAYEALAGQSPQVSAFTGSQSPVAPVPVTPVTPRVPLPTFKNPLIFVGPGPTLPVSPIPITSAPELPPVLIDGPTVPGGSPIIVYIPRSGSDPNMPAGTTIVPAQVAASDASAPAASGPRLAIAANIHDELGVQSISVKGKGKPFATDPKLLDSHTDANATGSKRVDAIAVDGAAVTDGLDKGTAAPSLQPSAVVAAVKPAQSESGQTKGDSKVSAVSTRATKGLSKDSALASVGTESVDTDATAGDGGGAAKGDQRGTGNAATPAPVSVDQVAWASVPSTAATTARSTSATSTVQPSTPITTTQTAMVIKQTADRIALLAAARSKDPVTIHLSPKELGDLTLVVRSLGDKVDADISATNDNVRNALQQHAGQLSQSLSQRGLTLGSVHVGSQGQFSTQGQSTARQQAQSQSQSPSQQGQQGSSGGQGRGGAATRPKAAGQFINSGVDFRI